MINFYNPLAGRVHAMWGGFRFKFSFNCSLGFRHITGESVLDVCATVLSASVVLF